jgi:hypothetical protein
LWPARCGIAAISEEFLKSPGSPFTGLLLLPPPLLGPAHRFDKPAFS